MQGKGKGGIGNQLKSDPQKWGSLYLTNVMSLCYHYAMKTTISLRLDKDLKEQLEELAKKKGRSVNNMLNVMIEEYLGWYRYEPETPFKLLGVNPNWPSPLLSDEVWQKYMEKAVTRTKRKEKEDGRT